MRPERKIGLELRDFLISKNWGIRSFNPPGLYGGIILLDRSEKRGRGSMKPDIIAQKASYVLIIEIKPKLNKGDIVKLEGMNQNHITDLQSKLNLPNAWLSKHQQYLQKALCVNQFMPAKSEFPNNYIIFCSHQNKIKVCYGEKSVVRESILND